MLTAQTLTHVQPAAARVSQPPPAASDPPRTFPRRVLRAFQRKSKSKMPWRHLIFSAEHGIVFPAPPTQQTTAKQQQDLEDLELLESTPTQQTTPKKQQHLELPKAMEKLGMSDTASSATTPSQSRRGSPPTQDRPDAAPPSPASLHGFDEVPAETWSCSAFLTTKRLERAYRVLEIRDRRAAMAIDAARAKAKSREARTGAREYGSRSPMSIAKRATSPTPA